MSEIELSPDGNGGDGKGRVWRALLTTSMSIPGARIDRATFLRSQLKPYVPEATVDKAIEERPAVASIAKETIDKLADSSIRRHVAIVATISFAAGLPGGWWIAATIPTDLAQFYYHAVVLSQKLAYLYGWPDLFEEEGAADDETLYRLTLFLGVMMGAQGANKVLAQLADRFAKEVAKRLPRQALTKYGFYNVSKQVGKWIGIQITKGSFARYISRIIPILGGVVSASVTVAMMRPMAKRLKSHLRGLRYAEA